MKVLHLIWKSVYITVLILGLLISILLTATYIFKDKITGILVSEMNKQIEAEVLVEKIDLNIYEKFPYISLKFINVKIKEGKGFANGDFAVAKELFFTFNPIDLLRKDYSIEQIYLRNSVVNITIDKEGRGNYAIFKEDSGSVKTSLSLDLKKVKLEDVIVNVTYQPSSQYYSILNEDAVAKFSVLNDQYFVGIEGDLYVYDISINGLSYFKNKQVKIKSEQKYLTSEKFVEILPSKIVVENSIFNIQGNYQYKDQNRISLEVEGEKGKIQTLLSLLPSKYSKELSIYESSGNIFFKGKIEGVISERENPRITVDFGFEDAILMHPETKGVFEKANLKGYFSNGKRRKAETSVLKISKFHGQFEGRIISGALTISNFNDPLYDFNCKGSINLRSFMRFYPMSEVKDASGDVKIDFSFRGKPEDLQQNPRKIKASGEIQLVNTNFLLPTYQKKFSDLNGYFIFNQNDVAISGFSGKVDNSDFLLNGYFRNLIGSLFLPGQTLYVQAELNSNHLNLNELLSSKSTASEKKGESPAGYYHMVINSDIHKLVYQDYTLKNIQGKIILASGGMEFKDVKANMLGGSINLSSAATFTGKKAVSAKADFYNIHIDSLFVVMKDFEQDYLTHKHLKGLVSGNFEINIPFTASDEIDFSNMVGRVKINFKNGELNGFSPMQKLSRFVEEHELYNVRFSELSNEFLIKDNKLSFSEMRILSNVSDISISGSHTFNNELDYKLTVPLKNFKRKERDKDAAFGAIEDDGRGRSVVYLTIKGPASDFKIAYDTKRTGQKARQDIKNELNEIKMLLDDPKRLELKNRMEQKNPELNQNEYFNFED